MSLLTDDPNISVATPGDWIPVDLEEVSAHAGAERLLGERVAQIPKLAPYREDLVGMLERTAQAAVDLDVGFAAFLADVLPDGAPVVASMSVALAGGALEDIDGEEVDLPAGPTRRAERTRERADGVLSLTVQYFTELAEIDAIAVQTFTTSTLGARRMLTPLFHEIARSLTLE
jgi:hypothetical protein